VDIRTKLVTKWVTSHIHYSMGLSYHIFLRRYISEKEITTIQATLHWILASFAQKTCWKVNRPIASKKRKLRFFLSVKAASVWLSQLDSPFRMNLTSLLRSLPLYPSLVSSALLQSLFTFCARVQEPVTARTMEVI